MARTARKNHMSVAVRDVYTVGERSVAGRAIKVKNDT